MKKKDLGKFEKYYQKIINYESYLQPFLEQSQKIYKMFRVKRIRESTNKDKDQYLMSVPTMYLYITTSLAKIVDTVLQPPAITVQPNDDTGKRNKALVEELLNYDLDLMNDTLNKHLLNYLLYPFAVLKVYPKDDKVVGLAVEPWNFYFDAEEYEFDNLRWMGNRVYVPLSVIKKNKDKIYINTDQVGGGYNNRINDIRDQVYPKPKRASDRVELIEIWDFDEKKVYTFANRSILVREMDMPYENPYILNTYMPLPGEIIGLSEAKPLFELAKTVNVLRNIRLNALMRLINPKILKVKGKEVDEEALKNPNSGVIVEVEDLEALKEMIFAMPSDSVLDENIARQDMERVAVAYPTVRGEMPARRETATALSIVSQNADLQYGIKIQYLVKNLIEPLAKRIYQYRLKYLPKDFILNGVKINKTGIQGAFTFKGVGKARVSKNQRKVELLSFIQFVEQSFPQVVQNPEIQKILFKEVLDNFDISNKEEIMKIIEPEQGTQPTQEAQNLLQQLQLNQPPIAPNQPPVPNQPPGAGNMGNTGGLIG